MHQPQDLVFHDLDDVGFADIIGASSRQIEYLRYYLEDLRATSAIEEQGYFDRDYLAEFAAFYGVSAKGYPNICRRIHFFSGSILDRSRFSKALAENDTALAEIQDRYLGFVVVRPIPAAPLGRTVLRWYPERLPNTPRVMEPSRDYVCHLSGIQLTVRGLAWQQQDSAVGACATVGLWSMLHTSAFDENHAIPTTADITRSAHRTASLGSRVFPSAGLTIEQLAEAIKEQSLAPVVLDGDIKNDRGATIGFSRERFAASCGAFVRSKYPVLIIGQLGDVGLHAACVVGFRETMPPALAHDQILLQDGTIQYFYVHDDNLGPSVRFQLKQDENCGVAYLETDAPDPLNTHSRETEPTADYHRLTPSQLIVAAHDDLRTSPDVLHTAGIRKATLIGHGLKAALSARGEEGMGLTLSTRFIKLADYLGNELSRTLSGDGELLARTRLALVENVPPMSLHIGVVRIAKEDATPLVDILYDTTDSDHNHPLLASVCFSPGFDSLLDFLEKSDFGRFGVLINSY